MSYDNAQMRFTHLVSYPSVWMPPSRALKLLIVSSDCNIVKQTVDYADSQNVSQDWAVYYLEHLDFSNQEHIDWILTHYYHCDNSLVNVCDSTSLAVAGQLNTKMLINTEDPVLLNLIYNGVNRDQVVDLTQFLTTSFSK